jgi:hypothetical protein
MRPLVAALAALALAVPGAEAQPQQRPLVSFVRTGGFIGATDEPAVDADGRATSSRGTFRLTALRLAAVKRSLRAARFATLRPKYRARVPIADGYTYRVRYAGRSILVEEGAETPARLSRLVLLLEELLSRRG